MRKTRPPSALPPAPPSHSRFGSYVLVDRIAVGGMAEVFRALAPQAVGEPRVVVVKRMLPSLAVETDARSMFHEEARLGALVRHPNVVNVLGSGEERSLPFIALEFVRGVDLWRLGRWLRRTGRSLNHQLAVHILREALAGLHAVHEARDEEGRPLGIVHRDVSPSNILLSVYGDVKLGDFGIARALLREAYPQAPVGERAKGKLGYLAPEQVSGGMCDRRADVFAAGVIAAELLMGRPLFAGGSELAVLLAIRDAKLQPFLEAMPSLPTGLGEVVLSALARSPRDRSPSADAFRQGLAGFEELPAEMLQRELAQLVMEASSNTEPLDLRVNLTSPAEAPASQRDLLTEPPGEATPQLLGSQDGPATAKRPIVEYELEMPDGNAAGPWPYAKVVEAVATGQLGASDRVRPEGGAFRAIDEITDLARHLPPSSLTTNKRDAPRAADEVISLKDGGIVRALGRATLRGDTGLLLCELGEVRKEVYIKDGAPEFVTSNLASELLGEYLASNGAISRGELDMALAVMPRFEGRLGDTLVALGLVEPVHLFQHIAGQVRAKLLDLFSWSNGTASLYRGVPPPPSGFPLGIDPWQIVFEGLRRRIEADPHGDWPRSRPTGKLERAEAPDDFALARLPASARAILGLLAEPASPNDLTDWLPASVHDSSPGMVGIEPVLAMLLKLDLIRWSEPSHAGASNA